MQYRPPWFDPSLPADDDCVLRALLQRRAEDFPDEAMALFEDGTQWSWLECLQLVRRTAAGLQRLGVRKGDMVAVWLPNGPTLIRLWFATNYLGAVFVPLNTAYRGSVLEHVLNLTGASLLVAHGDLIERLKGLDAPHLDRVVVVGGDSGHDIDIELVFSSVLDDDITELGENVSVGLWDTQSVIFTSGTTGPSKGVLSPYLQLYTTAVVNYGKLQQGETILVNLPIFHVGGTSAVYAALVRGGRFFLVNGFSTTEFWNQVRHGNCVTTSGLIGAMAPFIARGTPRTDDADNPLKFVPMFPINDETLSLGTRFGFEHLTGFNMSEVSSPLISDMNSQAQGSCGRPRSGVTVRLVDEHDLEVEPGDPGELVIRTDLPWAMNAGYLNMPEATAEAWRNGWFHTGDVFRQNEEGEFFFVDRRKDTIRRRGENVSSVEVENIILGYPSISEVAVVGVPSDYGEEEILAVLVAASGEMIDPVQLTDFLTKRLAYFMVPRYIRTVESIPKTETNKPRKILFREVGITKDTWDREAAGIRLRRERLDNT